MQPQNATIPPIRFSLFNSGTGLVLAVWLLLLAVMNLAWGTPLLSHLLPDADDYLRMSRIFDLLDGKHYPSYLQPRLGPGDGVENGWSRFIDGPLYLLMLFFQLFTDRATAALLTATFFPALALLVLLFAAVWQARAFMPVKPALTLFIVCLLWGMLHQFMPGRVDHHDWQIVLVVLSYGCLFRMSAAPENPRYPVIAGALFATGLAIGADIVPWFVMGVAFTGFQFLVRGVVYEWPAFILGISVMLVTALHFFLLVPSERFLTPECDTISPVYLSFAAAVMFFWGVIYYLPAAWKNNPARRLIVSMPVAFMVTVLLYKLFPSCFHDIYRIDDELVRTAWLKREAEAQPLSMMVAGQPLFAFMMLAPVFLGLTGTLWAVVTERERWPVWTALAIILLCGLGLTSWQFRTLDYLQALVILPLAWLLQKITMRIKQLIAGLSRAQRIGGEIAFALLALGFFMAAVTNHKGREKLPPDAHMWEKCSVRDAAPALNAITPPLMIAAYVDEGSELLYRTPHHVLAAPYHRDAEGIGASYRIFTAPNAEAAHKIVSQYKVGLILVCEQQRAFWRSISPQKNFFAAQLLDGTIPSWLSPVEGSGAGNIRIYRVRE